MANSHVFVCWMSSQQVFLYKKWCLMKIKAAVGKRRNITKYWKDTTTNSTWFAIRCVELTWSKLTSQQSMTNQKTIHIELALRQQEKIGIVEVHNILYDMMWDWLIRVCENLSQHSVLIFEFKIISCLQVPSSELLVPFRYDKEKATLLFLIQQSSDSSFHVYHCLIMVETELTVSMFQIHSCLNLSLHTPTPRLSSPLLTLANKIRI